MPKSTAAHNKSLENPAMCELLPVRDFLDDVMVRDDGSFVAGIRLSGAQSYFADDDQRNEIKHMLESLLLTVPEESMRLQFRYEVVEHVDGLLDQYRALRSSNDPRALLLDEGRHKEWSDLDAQGEYLTRYAAAYFIWNPEVHAKVTGEGASSVEAARKQKVSENSRNKKAQDREPAREKKGIFSNLLGASVKANITRTRAQHRDALARFEALMTGAMTALKRAGLGPTRMSHDELFLEIKRALHPVSPDTARLREFPLSTRLVTAREQLASVSILGQAETYINIDGLLWSAVTLKLPPDSTMPGVIRELLTLGFPVSISTQLLIPDQRKVLGVYKRRYKKMQAAQLDGKGGMRADVGAAVAAREILHIQERIIASSVKTCRVSMTILIRTSQPAFTDAQYEAAEQEIASRSQRVLHVIGRMNGARGFQETLALRRLIINSLPGMVGDDKRDLDLLTEHAADLVAVEVPWAGTTDEPAMLFRTPYRQLLPLSHFSPSLENANMILAATSGTGKGVLVGKMLLTYARQDAKISILERGDSYASAIEFMGGQMLTMSLDSPHTINPFDLDPGQNEPTNDHVSFLKNLIRYMVGDSTLSDADLLDSVILRSIRNAYQRALNRIVITPTLSDVVDELKLFIDDDKNERVIQEAKIAATKLRPWVDEGMYAGLFDRQTTVDMNSPWLYFNVEKLKDDPKLETAMSLLIAYATTKRAQGKGRQKSITVLDECWSLLESPSLGPVVVQLFRTARKRNAAVWAVSQAIADFTGTIDKPSPFGEAIMTTTATKIIGRQKGNTNVLRDFVHLNDTTISYIKKLGMTEKGKKSEFIGVIGENAETTFCFEVITTPLEYWIMTTFPREKDYRAFWLKKHAHLRLEERYALLASRYPHGLSALGHQPEELSGEVWAKPASLESEPSGAQRLAGLASADIDLALLESIESALPAMQGSSSPRYISHA